MHPAKFSSKDVKNEPSLLGTYHRKMLKAFGELSNKYLLHLGICYKVRNQAQFVKMCPQLQDLHLFWSGQGTANQVVTLVFVQTQVQN